MRPLVFYLPEDYWAKLWFLGLGPEPARSAPESLGKSLRTFDSEYEKHWIYNLHDQSKGWVNLLQICCVISCSTDILRCIASLMNEPSVPRLCNGDWCWSSAFYSYTLAFVLTCIISRFKPTTVIVISDTPLACFLFHDNIGCTKFGCYPRELIEFETKQLQDSVGKWTSKEGKIIHGRPSSIDNAASALGTTAVCSFSAVMAQELA